MPSTLTPKQQQFLNDYIRKHSIRGIGKSKDADNFLRRKSTVVDLLDRLPDFVVGDFRRSLAEADKSADEGDFSGAYERLKSVKKLARERVREYDPTRDLATLRQTVEKFTSQGDQALRQWNEYTDWNRTSGQKLNLDPTALPERDLSELESDLELPELELPEQPPEPSLDILAKFLTGATAGAKLLFSRLEEMTRVCVMQKERLETAAIREIFQFGLGNLDPLMRTTEEFYTLEELTTSKESQERERDSQFLGPRSKDLSLPVPEEFKTLDIGDVMKGFKDTLPERKTPYLPEDQDFQRLKASAREEFKSQIERLKLNPRGDEMFDLSLKSAEDFRTDLLNKYTAERGWNPKKLTSAQKGLLDAAAAGMFEVVRETCLDRVDQVNGEPSSLSIGGVTYTNPKLIGQGSFGKVLRFTDDKGGTVVVKQLLDPKNRNGLKQELIANRRLMQGDPNAPGRKNIVAMKGAAQDENGNLYMAMESAEGGDMTNVKGGMTAVSLTGQLPEMARNVLNQYLLKQSIEGLQYLRDQNMVHFDLKELNIMFDKNGTAKLGDFGSTLVGSNESGGVNFKLTPPTTGKYTAPELGKQTQKLGDVRFLRTKIESLETGLQTNEFFESHIKALGALQLTLKQVKTEFDPKQLDFELFKSTIEKTLPLAKSQLQTEQENLEKLLVDSSFDTFSLGRMMGGMHSGSQPRIEVQGQLSSNLDPENFTGAFERLVKSMTDPDPNKRPDLEGILDSSYIRNLDDFDPQMVQSLLETITEYGSSIDTDSINELQHQIGIVGSGSIGRSEDDEGRKTFARGNLREQLQTLEDDLKSRDQLLPLLSEEEDSLQFALLLREAELDQTPENEEQHQVLKRDIARIEMELLKVTGEIHYLENLEKSRQRVIRTIEENEQKIKEFSRLPKKTVRCLKRAEQIERLLALDGKYRDIKQELDSLGENLKNEILEEEEANRIRERIRTLNSDDTRNRRFRLGQVLELPNIKAEEPFSEQERQQLEHEVSDLTDQALAEKDFHGGKVQDLQLRIAELSSGFKL